MLEDPALQKLANFRWARSPVLESAQYPCAAALEERMFCPQANWARNRHLPCSFCITLAMSTDDRPKNLGEAMLSRRSCMTRWVTEDPPVLSGSSPLLVTPSPPLSSLSLSLFLSLSNFTAGPGPIESQVSCSHKQVYRPIEALLPFTACKREAC